VGDPANKVIEARRALIILVATCRQTLDALEAVDNPFDVVLTQDLRTMIARSESDLRALDARIARAGG
jgi:hypothetical protein